MSWVAWVSFSQDVGKIPTNYTSSELDRILKFGIFTQNATFHNITMVQTVDHLLSQPTNLSSYDLSYALSIAKFPQHSEHETLQKLQQVLHELLITHATSPRKTMIVSLFTLFTIISIPFAILRFYAKYYIKGRIRLDDWMMLVGLITTVGFGVTCLLTVLYGNMDNHIWLQSFQNLQQYQFHVFIAEIFYILALYAVKLTFFAFYYNLCPPPSPSSRSFRMAIIIILVVNTVVQALCLFLTIFQCKKMDWWNTPLSTRCLDREALFVSTAAISALADVVMLLLPIPAVLKLNLKPREKGFVIGLFLLGGVVCIASIIKIITLNGFFYSTDITSKGFGTGIWSQIELNLALIVSCVPALKAILVKYAPRILDSRHRSHGGRSRDDEWRPYDRSWLYRRGPRRASGDVTNILADVSTSVDSSTVATLKGEKVVICDGRGMRLGTDVGQDEEMGRGIVRLESV